MEKEVKMELEKETKGTVRYKEVGDAEHAVIGTLYVKKGALSTPYPTEMKVTLSF